MLTLKDVEDAKVRLGGAIYRTPCFRSEHFTRLTDCLELYCKLENLQRTGSFKERGALNKMLMLSDEERERGVVAASAGNHAQGLAFHAARLGISATIVMPERTPLVKTTATAGFGARVILAGSDYDEAYERALTVQREEGRVFVHPFDDPEVIAGQGTIGLELLEQYPRLEMVVVPVGGGGLATGIGLALKTLNPAIEVVGVQTARLPSMKRSVEAGQLVDVPKSSTIADGIAVKRPGRLTFELAQRYLDEVVTVDDEEIANAILLLLEREKTVVEGAGAVGMAALIHGRIPRASGKRVALVLSGGNIDVNVISRIIERGLVKEGRLVRLKVNVPDRPGTLAGLMTVVAQQGANVVEIHHNRAFSKSALGYVEVELNLETRGPEHVVELGDALEAKGWTVSER